MGDEGPPMVNHLTTSLISLKMRVPVVVVDADLESQESNEMK